MHVATAMEFAITRAVLEFIPMVDPRGPSLSKRKENLLVPRNCVAWQAIAAYRLIAAPDRPVCCAGCPWIRHKHWPLAGARMLLHLARVREQQKNFRTMNPCAPRLLPDRRRADAANRPGPSSGALARQTDCP